MSAATIDLPTRIAVKVAFQSDCPPLVRLRLGDPVALLPLLHYTLLRFSKHVAQCIARAGYQVSDRASRCCTCKVTFKCLTSTKLLGARRFRARQTNALWRRLSSFCVTVWVFAQS